MARRLPDTPAANGKKSQPVPRRGQATARRAVRPTVLLTGFEPFDGSDINPSWQIARALHGRQIAGHRVQALCLPTAFGQSLQVLRAALVATAPQLCVALGQAGGRAAISLERVAINVDDARIADNAGASPVDQPVVPGAPAAYFSSLPIKAMREAVLALGLPAEVSQTAGTFVCNHVFFGLMHELATRRALRGSRGGFIHVPWLPQQCPPGQAAMALDDMVRAVHAALRCALQTTGDLRAAGGATH